MYILVTNRSSSTPVGEMISFACIFRTMFVSGFRIIWVIMPTIASTISRKKMVIAVCMFTSSASCADAFSSSWLEARIRDCVHCPTFSRMRSLKCI